MTNPEERANELIDQFDSAMAMHFRVKTIKDGMNSEIKRLEGVVDAHIRIFEHLARKINAMRRENSQYSIVLPHIDLEDWK